MYKYIYIYIYIYVCIYFKCGHPTSNSREGLSDPLRPVALANNSDPVVSYFHLAGVPAPET